MAKVLEVLNNNDMDPWSCALVFLNGLFLVIEMCMLLFFTILYGYIVVISLIPKLPCLLSPSETKISD